MTGRRVRGALDRDHAAGLADTLVKLAGRALDLGAINRTACYHPGPAGQRESVADHTVMLALVASALASYYHPELDLGLVTQLAAVHDLVEAWVGDTPTLRIDAAGRELKRQLEEWGLKQAKWEYARLPWVTDMMELYEDRVLPEARWVWAVDKMLPKLVHVLDLARGLAEEDITVPELRGVLAGQRERVVEHAGEWPVLVLLYDELARRAVDVLSARYARDDQR